MFDFFKDIIYIICIVKRNPHSLESNKHFKFLKCSSFSAAQTNMEQNDSSALKSEQFSVQQRWEGTRVRLGIWVGELGLQREPIKWKREGTSQNDYYWTPLWETSKQVMTKKKIEPCHSTQDRIHHSHKDDPSTAIYKPHVRLNLG